MTITVMDGEAFLDLCRGAAGISAKRFIKFRKVLFQTDEISGSIQKAVFGMCLADNFSFSIFHGIGKFQPHALKFCDRNGNRDFFSKGGADHIFAVHGGNRRNDAQ